MAMGTVTIAIYIWLLLQMSAIGLCDIPNNFGAFASMYQAFRGKETPRFTGITPNGCIRNDAFAVRPPVPLPDAMLAFNETIGNLTSDDGNLGMDQRILQTSLVLIVENGADNFL